MNLTFVTANKSNLENDDALLLDNIKNSIPNLHVETNSFLDKSVDWSKFDIINLKTAYGYYDYENEFINWLEHITNLGIKTLNPANDILWNMDKFYLRELEKENIKILPTIFVEQNEEVDLSEIEKKYGWHKIVIKPSVSAGGSNIFLCDPTNAESLTNAKKHILEIQKFSKVLIQEYNDSISINGEYSAIFIGGKYCYLIHKKPIDKFIASYSQGIEVLQVNNKKIEDCAKNIFNKMERLHDNLYVRIDLIMDKEELYLMELELIEPRLFFNKADPSFIQDYIKSMTQN